MTPEDHCAHIDLRAPVGVQGSGRQRYAAAMHFHASGQLSDAALEVFRICSARDSEDPADLLSQRGLIHDLPASPDSDGAAVLRVVIAEADRYLAGLPGPGIAEVRTLIEHWRSGAVTPQSGPPNATVDAYLAPALADLRGGYPALAQSMVEASPYLKWVTYDIYPANEIGPQFLNGHAFAALIGEDGAAIEADDFELGFFMIAPNVLYRDHAHPAPELYAPLTGPHGWRFGVDAPLIVKPAHEPVWNEPHMPHMTKTGSVPFLCLYSWTRDVNSPAKVILAPDWAELEAIQISDEGA
ncbi:MAG: dimethylsulfonioproprionate lyase family protein [Albidovulum sp.]